MQQHNPQPEEGSQHDGCQPGCARDQQARAAEHEQRAAEIGQHPVRRDRLRHGLPLQGEVVMEQAEDAHADRATPHQDAADQPHGARPALLFGHDPSSPGVGRRTLTAGRRKYRGLSKTGRTLDRESASPHLPRGPDGRAVALRLTAEGGKSGLHGEKAAGNARRG